MPLLEDLHEKYKSFKAYPQKDKKLGDDFTSPSCISAFYLSIHDKESNPEYCRQPAKDKGRLCSTGFIP